MLRFVRQHRFKTMSLVFIILFMYSYKFSGATQEELRGFCENSFVFIPYADHSFCTHVFYSTIAVMKVCAVYTFLNCMLYAIASCNKTYSQYVQWCCNHLSWTFHFFRYICFRFRFFRDNCSMSLYDSPKQISTRKLEEDPFWCANDWCCCCCSWSSPLQWFYTGKLKIMI